MKNITDIYIIAMNDNIQVIEDSHSALCHSVSLQLPIYIEEKMNVIC